MAKSKISKRWKDALQTWSGVAGTIIAVAAIVYPALVALGDKHEEKRNLRRLLLENAILEEREVAREGQGWTVFSTATAGVLNSVESLYGRIVMLSHREVEKTTLWKTFMASVVQSGQGAKEPSESEKARILKISRFNAQQVEYAIEAEEPEAVLWKFE